MTVFFTLPALILIFIKVHNSLSGKNILLDALDNLIIRFTTGILFLLALGLHIYYNWTPIKNYLKNKTKKFGDLHQGV